MNIEINDAALEARIQKQIHATGAASAEEALPHCSKRRRNRVGGFWKIRAPLTPKSGAASISSIEARVFPRTNWRPLTHYSPSIRPEPSILRLRAPQPALGAFPAAVASSLDGNIASGRAPDLALRRWIRNRARSRGLPKIECRWLPGNAGSSG